MAQHSCKSPLEKDLPASDDSFRCQSGQMWSRTVFSNIYQSQKPVILLGPKKPNLRQSLIFTINCPRIFARYCCKPGSGEHFCILQRTRTVCFGHQALLNCIALLSHEMSLSLWSMLVFSGHPWKMFHPEINENMWWITRIQHRTAWLNDVSFVSEWDGLIPKSTETRCSLITFLSVQPHEQLGGFLTLYRNDPLIHNAIEVLESGKKGTCAIEWKYVWVAKIVDSRSIYINVQDVFCIWGCPWRL